MNICLTNFLPTLYTCTESEGEKETRIKSETVTTKLGGEGYSPGRPLATPPLDESLCVKVKDISASWSYEREKLVLSNISMEVNKVSWRCCVRLQIKYKGGIKTSPNHQLHVYILFVVYGSL